jgi:hypothetical protein
LRPSGRFVVLTVSNEPRELLQRLRAPHLGAVDAAHEALKEALRSRSRAAPIRHRALAERAQNYLAQGKKEGDGAQGLEAHIGRGLELRGVTQQLAELG